jgi:DNA-binding MarR family transcriptional regulator
MKHRESLLQREIGQKKPFQSFGHEAVLAILRTADELNRRFGRVVAAEGLTSQQYNVLRILRGAEPDGLPTLTIAERMIERTPGITGLIDRLGEKGLVRRERCPRDRRRVLCHITARGLEVLGRLDEPVGASDDMVLDVMSERDAERLIVTLDKVRIGA